MAALRRASKRIITKENARNFLRLQQRVKRKLQKALPSRKQAGRLERFIEIVATTAQEAQSGMFKPVGDIFIFSPELAEPFLWQRIRLMHLQENWEIWWHPRYGLRKAMTTVGLAWPVPEFIKMRGRKAYNNYIPQGLIDLRFKKKIPARIDPIEKKVVEQEVEYEEATYEKFVTNKWLPLFLYGNRHASEGMFRDTQHAQGVAKIFGVTVDLYASSTTWFKTPTPEVNEYVKRQSLVSEEAYVALRDAILHAAHLQIEQGYDPQLNWQNYEQRLKDLAGPRAAEITARLRAEIEPEVARMMSEEGGFSQNPSFRRPGRGPKRPDWARNVLVRPSRR
jgi:hypothetical protein